jgi:ABC-type transport system involved in multi-copper enzyme maturation permease subunit
MKMPKDFSQIARIAKYTVTDEVRQRSFIVMFVICALFVFLVRGCYHGTFTVSGQAITADELVRMVSKITFNVIVFGVMFLAGLLSMRVFTREKGDGTQSNVLSKPIARWQYVAGKILGLWILLTVFMFILHGIVFMIALMNTGIAMPEYFAASLLCSLNLLFVVVAVLLLSLMMPDIAALLSVMAVGIIGAVSEGIHAIGHNPMTQAMMQQSSQPDFTFRSVVYYLWPKLLGAQYFASSLIGGESPGEPASIYPLMNVMIYCLVLGAMLFWRFAKEEIV